ncbi:hypothetical protein SAMN03080615_00980 [Amphritea atlantica]|uniref:Na+/H+ antiporter NhaD n=1 Tax=Amphritea atlantica TaxID=355243 RepID=A0A1H9EMC2_9GAMM|nr:hypothetical protein [Amphritea atlantica]SEQ26864.1 hypothetical protein SAMN03080615_00980 [Amphritea atlantica]
MDQKTISTLPLSTRVTGWTLLLMLLLSLITALTHAVPDYVAGAPVWLAAALLIRRQRPNQLIQSAVLLIAGATGLAIGVYQGVDHRYLLKALAANQLVIAMLIGVSFLRIVAIRGIENDDRLPAGRKPLLRTLFGTHLIAAVINISSVMIVGDRLTARRPLSPLQGLTLLRAFSICACWSPFFAAMGVVLISAPGAQLSTLIIYGLPTALTALLFSAWQIARHPDAVETQGYPMHFAALWMPLLLAILVLIAHLYLPQLSVITLVTLISILFTLIYLLLRQPKDCARLLTTHIQEGLPKMGSEVTLFLAAAVLASGVAALLESLQIRLAPEHFSAPEASLTLIALVGLALIGMHPVTSAVLAGSILMPAVSDPNLLGITLLLSWSIGVGLSPFSGVQLSLQSRYGISAIALMKLNRIYGPVMLATGFAVLWTYSAISG